MGKPVVLDASAWLTVLLEEEKKELVEPVLAVHVLVAPELIRYETANAVLKAKKSGLKVFKNTPLQDLLNLVWEFPVQMVSPDVWWSEAVALVEQHSLTFYDASYVACASAMGLPILTLDKKILSVAISEKIAPALMTA